MLWFWPKIAILKWHYQLVRKLIRKLDASKYVIEFSSDVHSGLVCLVEHKLIK